MIGVSGIDPDCAHRCVLKGRSFGTAFVRTVRTLGMLLSLVLVAGASAAADPVTIGVLAQGPPESVAARWTSTAQYLHERIPSRDFVIRPLTAATAQEAVDEQSVDLILLNP